MVAERYVMTTIVMLTVFLLICTITGNALLLKGSADLEAQGGVLHVFRRLGELASKDSANP